MPREHGLFLQYPPNQILAPTQRNTPKTDHTFVTYQAANAAKVGETVAAAQALSARTRWYGTVSCILHQAMRVHGARTLRKSIRDLITS